MNNFENINLTLTEKYKLFIMRFIKHANDKFLGKDSEYLLEIEFIEPDCSIKFRIDSLYFRRYISSHAKIQTLLHTLQKNICKRNVLIFHNTHSCIHNHINTNSTSITIIRITIIILYTFSLLCT